MAEANVIQTAEVLRGHKTQEIVAPFLEHGKQAAEVCGMPSVTYTLYRHRALLKAF